MQRALGSNPLCVVAPGKEGDSFTLDMATSAVAYGRVRSNLLIMLSVIYQYLLSGRVHEQEKVSNS